MLFSLIGLIGLSALLIQILRDGLPYLSTNIIFNYPSRHIDQAGLKSALFGTLWILSLTALISLPIGMGAAIYLEEFAKKNWITNFIEINIGNLAGVPSIVYGLLGLTIFVELLGLGRVVLAGALTMTLLILPIIILSTRESIKAVPNSYREAALALGATKWQMVKRVELAIAFRGFLTGAILDDLILLNYKESLEKNSKNINLFYPNQTSNPYYLEIGWKTAKNSSNIDLPNQNTEWNVTGLELSQSTPVTLNWTNKNNITFKIHYQIDDEYMLQINQEIENNSNKTIEVFPYRLLKRINRPDTINFFILQGILTLFLSQIEFIPILLFSVFIDYFASQKIFLSKSKKIKKKYLLLSLFSNLTLL